MSLDSRYDAEQLQKVTRYEAAELANLHLAQLVASEVAPLLRGFCGDFVPEVEQMSGSRQYIAKSSNPSEERSQFLLYVS